MKNSSLLFSADMVSSLQANSELVLMVACINLLNTPIELGEIYVRAFVINIYTQI